jgi:hypothetical protein
MIKDKRYKKITWIRKGITYLYISQEQNKTILKIIA